MTVRRPTRLARWHEGAIYSAFGALAVTGVAWLAFHHWIRVEGEFGPEPHPAEPIMLMIHGIASYALLILAGALIPVHVKLGWSTGRNKVSGTTLSITLGVLGVTALGLYYLGGESARSLTSLAHWLIGLGALPLLLIHVINGRRSLARPRRHVRRKRDG